jgi:hypothetical protein
MACPLVLTVRHTGFPAPRVLKHQVWCVAVLTDVEWLPLQTPTTPSSNLHGGRRNHGHGSNPGGEP